MRGFRYTILSICFCILLSTALAQKTIFVKQDGSGDGTSWEMAEGNLQTAINKAQNGDKIFVAAGTYLPGKERTDAFTLKKGVSIYGGFVGIFENNIYERNPETNITVLSGDLNQNGEHDSEDAYHVVFCDENGVDNTALLDGFVISGGHANGGAPHNSGGGIYCRAVSPVIHNNTIIHNRAVADGGGVYFGEHAFVDFKHNKVKGNSAFSGGGLSIANASVVLHNNQFIENESKTFGGGLYITGSYKLQLINNILTKNKAKFGAGACLYNAPIELLNNTIVENYALNSGGGLYILKSQVSIKNTILWDNQAHEMPQLYANQTSVDIRFSVLQGGRTTINETITTEKILSTYPLFEDTAAMNYQLQYGSPCINNGDPLTTNFIIGTSDLLNNPRIRDGRIDIGAYEFDRKPMTLYVSDSGDDETGIGTKEEPWASISHAVSKSFDHDAIQIDGLLTEKNQGGIIIDKNLTIKGKNPESSIIQAAGNQEDANNRLFVIKAGLSVTFTNICLRHGATNSHKFEALGATIRNEGSTLKLIDVRLTSNGNDRQNAAVANIDGQCIMTNCMVESNTCSGVLNLQHKGEAFASIASCRFQMNFSQAVINRDGNLNIVNSIIEDNMAEYGAGILTEGGQANITTSTIRRNKAEYYGGGIAHLFGGSMLIDRCAIVENAVLDSTEDGGGIYVWTAYDKGLTKLTISNTTISGNSAGMLTGRGGGLFTWTQGMDKDVRLISEVMNCTFANNQTGSFGAGIFQLSNEFLYPARNSMTVRNTILTYNGENNNYAGMTEDSAKVALMRSYTFSSDSSMSIEGSNNINNIDPMIEALFEDQDGFVVHLLQEGSPAINAGTKRGAPKNDQRGFIREEKPDLGACEFQTAAPANTFPGGFTPSQDFEDNNEGF